MSQYLSKEEIKQWRSSLEKITLEEYARKLGKVLEEEKQTSDIIDIVMKHEKRLYSTRETSSKQTILKIAKKSQEIQNKLFFTYRSLANAPWQLLFLPFRVIIRA